MLEKHHKIGMTTSVLSFTSLCLTLSDTGVQGWLPEHINCDTCQTQTPWWHICAVNVFKCLVQDWPPWHNMCCQCFQVFGARLTIWHNYVLWVFSSVFDSRLTTMAAKHLLCWPNGLTYFYQWLINHGQLVLQFKCTMLAHRLIHFTV